MIEQQSDDNCRGFVYIAWGSKYIEEAVRSALSVKKHMSYPITLITTEEPKIKGPFDVVMAVPFTSSYKDKILMRLSPYKETIFLDTDTFLVGPMAELFDMLKRFDVVFQPSAPSDHYVLQDVPMLAFPEPSAGIVAFRKSPVVEEFFDIWESQYDEQDQQNGPGAWDQRSFRAALWNSKVQLSMLGVDWQLISFEAGICMNKVRMVHGRGSAARRAARDCNLRIGPRVYIPRLGFTKVWHASPIDYLRLSAISLGAAMHRLTRLALHWSGLWRLPSNKRQM